MGAKYSKEEDVLILAAPYGELGMLAVRLGRTPKAVSLRRRRLLVLNGTYLPRRRNKETKRRAVEPSHPGCFGNKDRRFTWELPLARPAWFNEELNLRARR